ncbi:hypothetical protein FA15DRAFT_757198 [Coprinopsis marcescibilis]|uniref:F-box domain-containing protein n=1 Tax=Coprinopsis marcescibilis TaxID=230819 RepID=A0A5C3L5M3_COPMA|nr:hypothetical protein FA15DRAFT_757198 [Coprinopsis marcescibilis]
MKDMPMHQLPLELFEVIVDHLPRDRLDNEKDLKTVSLVCSAFRHPCQQRLFSYIQLDRPSETPQSVVLPGRKLLALFEHSPKLARYVQGLEMGDSDGVGWIHQDEDLPRALNVIVQHHNIRHLGLACLNPFSTIPPATKQAIATIFASRSFHSLYLHQTPISVVTWCKPSLTHLELDCIEDTEDDWTDLRPLDGPLGLQFLSVPQGDVAGTIEYLLQPEWIDLQNLKELFVSAKSAGGTAHFESITRLFSACPATLETLWYAMWSLRHAPVGPDGNLFGSVLAKMRAQDLVDFSRFSTLRNITLSNLVVCNTKTRDSILPFVTRLRNLSAPHVVETIRLIVRHGEIGNRPHLYEPPNADHWGQLDLLLTDKLRFARLKCVTIEIQTMGISAGAESLNGLAKARKDIASLLPGIQEAGILEMKAEEWYPYWPQAWERWFNSPWGGLGFLYP